MTVFEFFTEFFPKGASNAIYASNEIWRLVNIPFGDMLQWIVRNTTIIEEVPDFWVGDFTVALIENTLIPSINYLFNYQSLVDIVLGLGILVFVLILVIKIVIDIML